MATGVVYAFLPLYAVDALGATEGAAARLQVWLLIGSCAGGFGMGIVRDYTSQRTVGPHPHPTHPHPHPHPHP